MKELGGFLFAKVCRQYPPYVLGARVTIHDYGHESTVGFFVIASNLRRSNLSEIASPDSRLKGELDPYEFPNYKDVVKYL